MKVDYFVKYTCLLLPVHDSRNPERSHGNLRIQLDLNRDSVQELQNQVAAHVAVLIRIDIDLIRDLTIDFLIPIPNREP
jgi:hypothetical protein